MMKKNAGGSPSRESSPSKNVGGSPSKERENNSDSEAQSSSPSKKQKSRSSSPRHRERAPFSIFGGIGAIGPLAILEPLYSKLSSSSQSPTQPGFAQLFGGGSFARSPNLPEQEHVPLNRIRRQQKKNSRNLIPNNPEPLPATPQKIPDSEKPSRTWETLFDGNLCIGEDHDQIVAKKFLIQNMEKLKNEGFKYLILEHLSKKEHQEKVDDFFKEEGVMARDLKSRLNYLDDSIADPWTSTEEKAKINEFNFNKIFEEAKKHGLKIICAERSLKNYSHWKDRDRMTDLNTRIQEIDQDIKNKEGKETKWVALVGNGHLNERHGVPGICEIIENTQDLTIINSKKDEEKLIYEETSIEVEQEKKKFFKIGSGDDGLFASILIRLNPKDDADYDSLTKIKNSSASHSSDYYSEEQRQNTLLGNIPSEPLNLGNIVGNSPSSSSAQATNNQNQNKSK